MKNRIHILSGLAVLPFLLFSCNKVAEFQPTVPEPVVTIQASIPADAVTKVAPVAPESGSGLDWNWEAGDQIALIGDEAVSVFDIRSGFQPKVASFIGKPVNGSSYSILYPGSVTSVAELEALSFADQIQTGNDVNTHLQYFALLSGVNAYDSFEFSSSWASSHGGSFKQSGALRFVLTLPEETTVVNRITLKAGSPIFHKGNADDALSDELSVGLSEVTLGADHKVTAWMTTSWFDDAIPTGTALSVSVAAGDFNWVADITPAAEKTLKSGYVNTITLDADKWVSGGRYADGEGTEENPWLIKTPTQLTYVRDDLASNEVRYFKLVADLDMTGIEWAPLNNVDPYDKFIHFDGDGHTISNLTIADGAAYASFAGVLYGTLKDVTFNKASIVGGSGNKCGIVAGYVGTNAALTPCVITNVEVKNSTITGARSMGAFVGQVATDDAVFTNCHVSNTTVNQTVTSTSHAGGFVGYAQADAKYINCSSNATLNGTEYSGGFAGYIGKGTYQDCSASGTVSGTKHVGGFVGKSETPVLENCYYDGPQVSASASGSNQSGGFVGFATKASNVGGTFTNCYVRGSKLAMSAGQRIGGFVGQADAGCTFTKCYVQNVTIEGGQNSGGFIGVDYAMATEPVPGAGIFQCYVEGGSLTASGANPGGFVGYPEKALIQNCFTTMNVNGGSQASVGGFIGQCNKNVTVQYCYAAGNVEGTSGPIGGFVGKVNADATTHINACIAWYDTLEFAGSVVGGDLSGNYCGKTGTLAEQAAALGWDSAIWDFSAKLK